MDKIKLAFIPLHQAVDHERVESAEYLVKCGTKLELAKS